MAFLDETGLAELWSLITARDLKIATGSYQGTGTYGKSNPNTLTFDFQPKVLLVWVQSKGLYAPAWPYSNTNVKAMIAFYGNTSATTGETVTLSWSGTSVSWYNTSYDYYQLNYNTTHQYIAIG